jgi:hypothetical protein
MSRYPDAGALGCGANDLVCGAPFAVGTLGRDVEWHGEDVDVFEGGGERATPVFNVGPVCGERAKVSWRYHGHEKKN